MREEPSNIADQNIGTPSENESNWSIQKLLHADYKELGSPSEVEKRFLSFLLHSPSCLSAIIKLICTAPSTTRDFSLQLDAHEFIQADPILGTMLLRYPNPLLSVLENAIVIAQKEVFQILKKSSNYNNNFCIKGDNNNAVTRVHARLVHLPPHSSCCKSSIASLKAEDVGKIVQISGTVVRTSSVQMYESTRAYRCTSKKCGHQFVVFADLEQTNNSISLPSICPRQECKNSKFQVIEEGSVNTDYQEIKIQECVSSRLHHSSKNMIPRSLCVKLQHDLVDLCQPGDDIVIVGTVISQWKTTNFFVQGINQTEITMGIKAHSLRVVHGNSSTDNNYFGSWDRIFDDPLHNNGNDQDEENGSDNIKPGMIKEDVIKEFENFWSQHKKYPIAARNFICQAVCPKLYGMSVIKLALLLTIIGGCSSDNGGKDKNNRTRSPDVSSGIEDGSFLTSSNDNNSDCEHKPKKFRLGADKSNKSSQLNSVAGNSATAWKKGKSKEIMEIVQTRRREQSHMLLVGDPGTGKSQFLRFAAALCPRSIITTGIGTTSAGLTCAAVREGNKNEFSLEAGALVLADKGVCCIDEFGCIRASDRTAIHEAMEQQTLSIAKAGIVCKLNCRATIFAVCNPKKGILDHDHSLTENTGIELPLLSRFDLIFKLIDSSDEIRDCQVATFLLNRAIQGSGYQCANKSDGTDDFWKIEKLRAYIATVKSFFHPSVSNEAATLLQRHYERCRRVEGKTLKITVRFFESLIRLAQAHARLMFRAIVSLDDAVSVILIMETSEANSTSCFDSGDFCNNPMKDIFSSDLNADEEFMKDKFRVLTRYEMLKYIRNDEKEPYTWLNDLHQTGQDLLSPNTQNANSTVEDHYGRTQPSPAKSPYQNSPYTENETQSYFYQQQNAFTNDNVQYHSFNQISTDVNNIYGSRKPTAD